MAEMNLRQKLVKIQNELKAPKSNYNSFGKYKYRSCEDILEAVKPLMAKYNALLVISDEVIDIQSRLFVRATSVVHDIDSDEKMIACALAEIDNHKGMSADQCVGTASSYARKYCLNGLLCIDDTKDADTDKFKMQTSNNTKNNNSSTRKANTASRSNANTPTPEQKKSLMSACSNAGIDIKEVLKAVGCTGEMTVEQFEQATKYVAEKGEANE